MLMVMVWILIVILSLWLATRDLPKSIAPKSENGDLFDQARRWHDR
jgi:hypothetical protein